MKVIAFDYFDKDRKRPAEIELEKVKKGTTFTVEEVSYQITKIFNKKKYKKKCVELRMIAYKIKSNATTTFSHRCPAKKGQMEKMKPETKKIMKEKYGEKTIKAWEKGKNKMKIGSLTAICPDCGTIFYKDKHELPEKVEITKTHGKKRLIRRD